MIIAGDIGGTKTRLACFARVRGKLKTVVEETYPSQDYPSFKLVLQEFLVHVPRDVRATCLGVAGAVIEGRCKTTNLPWVVDAAEIRDLTGSQHAALLNDLEATAYSIDHLEPDHLHELQAGASDAKGNRAVIAAGTGLGEAGLFWTGRSYRPFASEGGHCDFAPRDDLQLDLLKYLLRRYEHISWERVLSGPGLVNIYEFLRDRDPAHVSQTVSDEMTEDNAAAVISQAALDQRCPVCVEALHLFVSFYGAEAGNLALKLLARGGLYIAGGIAPKILPALLQPTFLDCMATGRFKTLLKSIPVRVVLTDRAPLLGAAHYAVEMTRRGRR